MNEIPVLFTSLYMICPSRIHPVVTIMHHRQMATPHFSKYHSSGISKSHTAVHRISTPVALVALVFPRAINTKCA